MRKEELRREDGRYLVYYWFDDEESAGEAVGTGLVPVRLPEKERARTSPAPTIASPTETVGRWG